MSPMALLPEHIVQSAAPLSCVSFSHAYWTCNKHHSDIPGIYASFEVVLPPSTYLKCRGLRRAIAVLLEDKKILGHSRRWPLAASLVPID